jgi:glycosyltransferase involved in cell wall biosynthesis
MRFLFVVHRYYPFPGGSEYYVQAMAEESLSRGHDVAVLSGEHQGNQNGVRVSSDPNILGELWDLIIVHGGDVGVQNFVLSNASRIPSPILYMLILPSHSQVCVQALSECAYLGWSTPDDLVHIRKYNQTAKAKQVRHGIKYHESLGVSGFKQKYNISKRMFLSCGGYWPNKKMRELADVFKLANLDDAVLVTTGYDNRMDLMPLASENIIPLLIDDKQDVLNAISEAECYLMHSSTEGFGLVLLESMLNNTPWISRHMAGAAMLNKFGRTYSRDEQLLNYLRDFNRDDFDLNAAKTYAIENHTIKSTVDDIESIVTVKVD